MYQNFLSFRIDSHVFFRNLNAKIKKNLRHEKQKMCIIIINGNEIKELVSYDIDKNIYENVRVIVGNEEIENFFLVDDIFQNGDVISTKIPKQVSVFHKNFFPPKEYILPPITTEMVYKTSQTSIKKNKKYTSCRYCNVYNCNNFAIYGPKGKPRVRCTDHKLHDDETYNPMKKCDSCGVKMKYNKWYMHNKLCGMEEEQKCYRCGTITKNIFKHKYTCRSRLSL
jgi:hypothetical protein